MKPKASILIFIPLCACIENALFNRGEERIPQPITEETSEPSDEQEDLTNEDEDEDEREPSSETNSNSQEPDNSPADEPAQEPDENPGEDAYNPRRPYAGELVINEVMIDPDGVQDKHGEWIEIWNASGDWITLQGMYLADDNLDDYEIQSVTSNFTLEPNGYFLICADDNFWDNGGVDCHATFLYKTLGGGFALANTDDEIHLIASNGYYIDSFSYGPGFAPVGASMGLRNGYESASANNNPSNWCEQWDFMSSGDSGSPGESNFCF